MYEVMAGRDGKYAVKRIFIQHTPTGVRRISFFIEEYDTVEQAHDAAAALNAALPETDPAPVRP